MEGEIPHQPDSATQEVQMNDQSSNQRVLKIKSIDGNTYELTVPKDVGSRILECSRSLSPNSRRSLKRRLRCQ